ncbi:hypothetical protein HOLleu_09831 [Holothuria leucospilota]|uniref:Ig-like domain-containing protein n=1 Tax=Holothuria leucospilota TaxID=206669 RepID=A0A9Q1CE10_HOLLE|nr:hypothetical protein HOLleu_09831 [Holothuria leucospilota]
MATSLVLCMPTAIISLLIGLSVTNVSATCTSPQYAEYGHRGIIECNFQAGFTGVYWYLQVKSGYEIVIRLEKQEDGSVVRSGDGYSEEKFDILSNGSLIISNISSFHNQTFKVVHVDENLRVEEVYVELLATILPDSKFPVISVCNKTNLCLVEEIDSGILTCSYNHSKPPVELAWYRLSHEGTEALKGETIITEDGEWTFSSVSKTNISNHINGPLIAFSCRASSPAINSHFLESIVIIDTTKQPWPSLQGNVKEEKYFLINYEADVPCIDVTIPRIFVWKELQRNSSEILGFAANGNIPIVSNRTTRWTISHDGALIFSKANFKDEGLYSCTFLDGTKYVSNLEQVKVSVLPQPPSIIVNDCPLDKEKCEILMRDPSSPLNISCHLNGVYPNVTLNMETFGSDFRSISQTTYPAGKGNLYNATITKELLPIDCSTSLNLTCYISKPDSLKLVPEKFILVLSEECKKTESKVAAVVIPIVIITLICSVTAVAFFYRNHWNNFCRKKQVEDGNMESNNVKMEQPAVSEETNNTTSNVAEHDESENSKREHEASVAGSEKDASQNSHVKENAETENSERQHDSNGSETEEEDAETESYPVNYKDSKEVFDQHAIKIVRENPVNIQLERMGTMAKLVAGTAAVAITFLTFGFAAVLVLAGAAIGLTGVRIGLSSKELFEEPSKWQEVKPAFLNLIELLKNIAQAIAITCTAHETLENIRNDSAIVDEGTLKDTHDNIQKIIHKHERIQYLKQTDMIKQFREMKEDTKQLLNIIKISFSFTSFKLEEKVNIAMESPFNTFGDDALTRLDNYDVSATCASPQYAEYGHRGIIECNFMSGFTGVFWYLHVKPGYQIVIRLEKQEDGSVFRSGDGYTEGKFDIFSNGSLIITNISSFHNQTFKVVHLDENLRVKELYVELLTTILPDPKFPVISVCNKTNLCLVEEIDSGTLTCSYNHSKPPVQLAWYRISHEGTDALNGETIITKDGEWTFSSVSKTNISNHINGPLIAFLCRASSPAIKSHFLESIVIMDTTKQPWPSLEGNVKEERYFLINSEAGVPCIDIIIPRIFVWKELQRNASEILGFAANGNIRIVSNTTTRRTISHDGSLTFLKAKFEDEGLYSCTLLDGNKYVSNLEQVKVSVLAQPPIIIVNDCPLDKQKCEILVRDPSSPLNISCYLNGIYPNVTLNMETFGSDLRSISQTTYPAGRGNLYNATITKELPPIDCSTLINLTCYISRPVSFKLVPQKFILVLSEECKKTESKVAAVIIPIVIITLTICCVIVVFLFHRNNFCRQKGEDGNVKSSATGKEAVPLLGISESIRSELVGERKQDLLCLLNKTLTLIMSYPMNYKNSKEVFDKDTIKIVRDNPVNIQLKKDVGTLATVAGGAAAVAGAVFAFVFFPFGAVLAIAGAAVGLTGYGVGLSSKQLFEDPSKWQKVQPVFLSLNELLTSIVQTIAIACTAHETTENIRNDRVFVDESTVKDTHDNIQKIINKHQTNQYLKQTDLNKQFREIKEDIEELLNIIQRSYSFKSFHLGKKVNDAMESPFKNFGEDALTRLDNYGDVEETSSFVNFIRIFLIGDEKGNLHTTRFLENTARANENITKITTGIAAAGIVLKAAEEEKDIKFLGTDLEKLLGQKEEHTVALTDTVNLMERMNAVFAKLNK